MSEKPLNEILDEMAEAYLKTRHAQILNMKVLAEKHHFQSGFDAAVEKLMPVLIVCEYVLRRASMLQKCHKGSDFAATTLQCKEALDKLHSVLEELQKITEGSGE